jgi:shikimate kinase
VSERREAGIPRSSERGPSGPAQSAESGQGVSARHLALVGLMGAGKTTVGARCAERLERPFVDTDDVVEASTGLTVAEIFAAEGEAGFREHERRAVADVCASPVPLVIACGGGAVLDPANRAGLRASSLVVWLRAAPAALAERVADEVASRPLLRERGAAATLARLDELRTPAYEAAAHVTVDTDGCSVDEVVAAVLGELARCDA